jgi:dihydropyrimidinase
MELETVVRGGLIATSDAMYRGDIGIANGKVAAIGSDLEGDTVLDCSGLTVVPGAIDVHTHFETEQGGTVTADDYESGSHAAALGGITTYINYAFQDSGGTLSDALAREHGLAEGRSYVDYGFHPLITDPADEVIRELARLRELQATSVKIFMAVPGLQMPDRTILRVLAAAAEAGLLVNVHAEDGAIIQHETERLRAEGSVGMEAISAARPASAEALAITKVASFARTTGCPLYIVHLSSAAGLDAVAAARRAGTRTFVETRPAYLYLDEERYRLPTPEARQFVCWPPLRTPADQDALWKALADGVIETYATDHTTFMAAEKADPSRDFAEVPGGVSNVQTSIGMLYSRGVKTGRLSLSRYVAAISTNPAKLFGMWPRKGTIAVGSDADLTVIDPERKVRIEASAMASRSDFDPYDGMEETGWPVMTISRGAVIAESGRLVGDPSHGRLVPRDGTSATL